MSAVLKHLPGLLIRLQDGIKLRTKGVPKSAQERRVSAGALPTPASWEELLEALSPQGVSGW